METSGDTLVSETPDVAGIETGAEADAIGAADAGPDVVEVGPDVVVGSDAVAGSDAADGAAADVGEADALVGDVVVGDAGADVVDVGLDGVADVEGVPDVEDASGGERVPDVEDASDVEDVAPPEPCVVEDCDDGEACTDDYCSPNGLTCVYVWVCDEMNCADGIDDDGDGDTDCEDLACWGLEGCAVPKEHLCGDGVDDEGDGLTDCEDTDCEGLSGCEPAGEESCGDGFDNDADGATDCADLDCGGLAGCEPEGEATCDDAEDNDADGATDCADADCDGIAGCEPGGEGTCDDGFDNDADGLFDCADGDCQGIAGCEPAGEQTCDDGFDNDVDGATDCVDADCDGVAGCEHGAELTCDDGFDNDVDGATDCADPDCDGVAGCELGSEASCADGADNDADGATDCADLDCDGVGECEPGGEVSCVDGVDNDGDGGTDCHDADCDGVGTCEHGAEETCDDGLDNDVDGSTDCHDADCHGVGTCEHGYELSCEDGVDNDVDGATDCLDVDCDGVSGCEYGAEETCGDGVDNDADGLTDCLDPNCDGVGVCEYGTEDTCGGGVDNDSDGLTDCADPDCDGEVGCEYGAEDSCDDGWDNDADGVTDCFDPDCDGVDWCEVGAEQTCDDGIDNDVDLAVDCLDDDCDGVAGCEVGSEATCDDGFDNDSDGATDCQDGDCDGVGGCEHPVEVTCGDGLDNDGDGLSDCEDFACDLVSGCEFGVEETCNDTVDNDADGLTDCDDPNCATCEGACCGAGTVCVSGTCKVECPSGLYCGPEEDVCCGAGEACLGQQCILPSGPCEVNEDCPDGEVCEPVLAECIPEGLVEPCEFVPEVGVLAPVVGCRWTPPADAVMPGRDNVCMNPVVANLSDDNGDGLTNRDDVPDIAFTAWDHDQKGCCDAQATLWIVSGQCEPDATMVTLAEVPAPNLDESGGLAVGDLNGDGVPEIVAMLLLGGSVAYERTADDGSAWEILWENLDYPTRGVHTNGAAQPALADLDGDGYPEVIVGNVALSGLFGTLVWDGVVTAAGAGGIGNNAFLGPVSVVADVDLDMQPEVIAGNTVYSWDGAVEWTLDFSTLNTTGGTCQGSLPCDGYTAVGNFDEDPEGEVVIVRQGEIFIVGHDGVLAHQIAIPWQDCVKGGIKANESGPPTIADFDGDGFAEIGTAGADYYAVIDLQCVGDPLPEACFDEYIRWATPNQDCSSRATASSVFDFEGDGKAEVVYADETSFRILDGTTGAVLYTDTSHGSNTRVEMPVIADVDNDGSAEIVIPENNNGGGTPGIEVWRDAEDNWVRSRRIWNQHGYHITNVSEDGIVPAYEPPNWLDSRYNNFRQNVQPTGLFDAPDLWASELSVACPGQLEVTVCVGNEGALGVPAGVNVAVSLTLFDGSSATLPSTVTPAAILPGQCVDVPFVVPLPPLAEYGLPFEAHIVIDDDGTTNGAFNECDELDNVITLWGACPY